MKATQIIKKISYINVRILVIKSGHFVYVDDNNNMLQDKEALIAAHTMQMELLKNKLKQYLISLN